ncbi:LysR family transcriptional regulator [Dictyobacter kobayashii]|uniref:Nitrogen assimilation transcriptional activator n=1 Tax=Dictyobacter kobayashii TaxID=2014872 RepID=A0A402AGU4_9CHLR|nr:LysR family transcriptional regulator [Dictyobacter kobayashii]GCE18317.1 nitrogen assimilation transcriptional activator [Dictyobacter kobayashii]
MDSEQLLTFERIIREGSFSQAARALNLSQPTMSTRMQALEEDVGGALFVRGGRKVALTERGESFLPYARRALEILTEGKEVAQLTQEGKRGRVTIGTLESFSGGLLAATIAQFHQSHPEVEIFVRTGHSQQIEQMLYDGVTRLGLLSWPFLNPDLKTLLRFKEPLIFVAPPQHPLAQQPYVTAEDIHMQATPLLLVQKGFALSDILTHIYPHPERTMELPVQTARELLRQGIGAAFITRTAIADELASGQIVEIAVQNIPPAYRESALVHLSRSHTLPAASRDFIAALRQQAGAICLPDA